MRKKVLVICLLALFMVSAIAREYEYANIPYGSSVEAVRKTFLAKGYTDMGYMAGVDAYIYSATIYDELAYFTCSFDDMGLCALRIDFPAATTASPVFYAVLQMMSTKYGKPTDETQTWILWNGDSTMAGIRTYDNASFDVEYYKTSYAQKLFNAQAQELKDF